MLERFVFLLRTGWMQAGCMVRPHPEHNKGGDADENASDDDHVDDFWMIILGT